MEMALPWKYRSRDGKYTPACGVQVCITRLAGGSCQQYGFLDAEGFDFVCFLYESTRLCLSNNVSTIAVASLWSHFWLGKDNFVSYHETTSFCM